MRERCAWDGCPNLSDGERGLCRTHRWRRQHNKPMDAPIRPHGRSPAEGLRDAARALADSASAEAWRRCAEWHRLRVAAARYFKSLGWRLPPKSHT